MITNKETQEDFGLTDDRSCRTCSHRNSTLIYQEPCKSCVDNASKPNWTPNTKETKAPLPVAPIPKTSGGNKLDAGKPPMGLLDSLWLTLVAKVLGFGAKKYAAHNWRKGIELSRIYDGVQRHLTAWNDGEDLDPESGLPHLAHASCGMMFLTKLSTTRPDLDDRYHKLK